MLFSTAGLLLLAFLPNQEAQSGEQARRTADAARAITREFGLSSWSDRLITQGLASTTNSTGRSTLLLARCDVLSAASNREFDLRLRLTARAGAGGAYVDYLATSPDEVNQRTAQIALARIAFSFGNDVNDVFQSGTLDATQQAELLAQAQVLFTPALQGMNSWLSWFEGLDNDSKDAYRGTFQEMSYYRALTFLNWAKLYPKDSLERSQYANRSLDALEDFALAAPPAPAMVAYKCLADAYTVMGEYQDAEDYYVYVIDSAVPDDPEATWPGAGAGYIDRQIAMLQESVQDAYLGMLDMLVESSQLGRVQPTLDAFDVWEDDQRPDMSASGWRLRLRQASMLIDEGRVGDAVALADKVAQENKRSMLQLEANSVMAAAIAAAPPDAEIPLDILYQAAEGAYYSKDYWGAVDGFRALIPRLAGSPEAGDYGGRAYYFLGASWTQLGFPLLSGLAHEIGYKDYESAGDEYVDRNARIWLTRTDQMIAKAPGDEVLSKWNEEALASQIQTPDKAVWLAASRKLKTAKGLAANAAAAKSAPGSAEANAMTKGFDDARDLFLTIEPESKYYEQALLEAAGCDFAMMVYDAQAGDRAKAAYKNYLDVYIADAANEPQDNYQRKIRTEKEPLAVFNLARTHRAQALSGQDADANWQRVFDLLDGFAERFPSQIPMAAAGHGYRIQALIHQSKIAEAEQEFETLRGLLPKPQYLAGAAYHLYLHFIATGVEGVERSAFYLGEMNRNASSPRWGNLRSEGDLRLALLEPAKAEKLYTRVLNDFGSELTDNMRLTVRMSLVDSLLLQRKLGVAVPIIEEVYASKPKRRDVKQALVKVKLGFLLYEDGLVIEVPGEASNLSDPDAAAAALILATHEVGNLLGLATYEASQLDPQISYYEYAPWWEAKLSQGYLFLLRGRIDAADAGKHLQIVGSLEFQAPELGANIVGAGTRVAKCLQWLKTQR